MKLGKLLLTVVTASVLLGTFVSSSSARNLSVSEQRNQALFRRLSFSGGFGEVICEVLLSGSFHGRTSTKTVNSLSGYITEATVLRCAAGNATINQASLPWHRRFRGFTGTLPNIATTSDTITGVEWSIREPIFGITCTVSRTNSSTIGTYTREAGGAITRAEVSGSSPCGSFTGTLSGSETNVVNDLRIRSRITVMLI